MLGLLLAALLAPAPPAPSVRAITHADDIIAIYHEDAGLVGSPRTKLVLAAWSDGYVVWSENQEQGGPPYRAAEQAPARLSAILARAADDGVFRDESLSRTNFGPDSKFTTILLKSGKRQVSMRSWHELYEREGKLVAGTAGLRALEGTDRLGALRREPAEYLYYRLVWAELRQRALDLVTAASRPVVGEIVVAGGSLSWREGPSLQKGAGS